MYLPSLAILVCCIISMAACVDIKYKDCGSQVGKLEKVEVFPCDNPAACRLHHNKSYTINVTFTAAETTSQSFDTLYGIIKGIKVPFISDHDACKGGLSGLKCPIESGKQYRFTTSLPIKQFYPNLKIVAEWKLVDAESYKNGNIIFCFKAALEIVK
ncbi:unnamed protein product [Clavelina lepadiformis]|uniref:MD-2-related lipid-recognition domain-containing protein n=1 Tax=Clavelina lepadiformis TaxID=159417 RepID=A0ABP0F696_CLALP